MQSCHGDCFLPSARCYLSAPLAAWGCKPLETRHARAAVIHGITPWPHCGEQSLDRLGGLRWGNSCKLPKNLGTDARLIWRFEHGRPGGVPVGRTSGVLLRVADDTARDGNGRETVIALVSRRQRRHSGPRCFIRGTKK